MQSRRPRPWCSAESTETKAREASSDDEAADRLDRCHPWLRRDSLRRRRSAADSRSSTQGVLFERLQFLAGLKAHCFAWRDRDLGAGTRIAPDAGLARAHVEDSEAAQLNTLAAPQGALHAFKDGFHSHLGLGLGDARSVHHFINDVEFDQVRLLRPKPNARIGVSRLSRGGILRWWVNLDSLRETCGETETIPKRNVDFA